LPAVGPQDLIAAPAAIIHPILDPTAVAAELLTHVRIVVFDAVTVFRSVLPVVAAQGINLWPVYVDVVVVPVGSATPVISA
jgi:hypothetical protein